MPTPRRHGGAELIHLPLVVPGFFGLNKQESSGVLPPEWATELTNTTIDENNRLASRKGFNTLTTTPAADALVQLQEYRKFDGTTELIASLANSTLVRSTDNGATWATITGTATPSGSNVQFWNFNDALIGITPDGDAPVRYTGTTFADLTDGGAEPLGSVGLSAFGRMWITDSNNTAVKYSALLDETDWSGPDTGSIDMKNIWPEGDTVTALAAFNGALVIFGRNNIAIYSDNQGSALGIDPAQIYLADTISGVGCVARDSVANIEGDLWFLSDTGLQSLSRLIQEKSNPLDNLSKHVRDFLGAFVRASSASDIRAVYSPVDRIYLLSVPRTSNGVEAGRAFAFDTRGRLQDGSARCIGVWDMVPRCSTIRQGSDQWVFSLFDVTGEVGIYDGFTDNGTTYSITYESGWLDFSQGQGWTIIPKRIAGLFWISSDTTVTVKWAFGFTGNFRSSQITFSSIGTLAEYGVAEFGEDEFGAGLAVRDGKVAGSGTGEFIKLGVSADISGELALQSLDVFAKIGRFK